MTANPLLLTNPTGFPVSTDWRHFDFDADNTIIDNDISIDPQLKLSAATSAAADASMMDFAAPFNSQLYQKDFKQELDLSTHYNVDDGIDPSDTIDSAASTSSGTKHSAPSSRATSFGSDVQLPPSPKKRTRHNRTSPTPSTSVSTRKTPRRDSKQQQGQKSAPQDNKNTTTSRQRTRGNTNAAATKKSASQRTKCLERNRVAASKCRQKKKEWMHDLEGTKAELETQHLALQVEVGRLQEEVNVIKNMLTAHAACGDANINTWIDSEASRFVQRNHTQLQSRSRSATSFSPPMSTVSEALNAHSPPVKKEETFNYDYMPDELFNDDTL